MQKNVNDALMTHWGRKGLTVFKHWYICLDIFSQTLPVYLHQVLVLYLLVSSPTLHSYQHNIHSVFITSPSNRLAYPPMDTCIIAWMNLSKFLYFKKSRKLLSIEKFIKMKEGRIPHTPIHLSLFTLFIHGGF